MEKQDIGREHWKRRIRRNGEAQAGEERIAAIAAVTVAGIEEQHMPLAKLGTLSLHCMVRVPSFTLPKM